MLPAATLPCGNQAFGKTLSSFNHQAHSLLGRRTHKKRDSQESRRAEGTLKWAGLISRETKRPPHRLRFGGNGLQVPLLCVGLRIRGPYHHLSAHLCRHSVQKHTNPTTWLPQSMLLYNQRSHAGHIWKVGEKETGNRLARG